MERELQEYIEELKLHMLEIKDMKKVILKIKRYLDKEFECYEDEIAEGEITKQQIIEEFLKEHKEESEENVNFQSRITFLFSQYEACKKIIKTGRKSQSELNSLINAAKRIENNNKQENLHNTINMKEEIITCLRIAIRDVRDEKLTKGKKDYINATPEEIIAKIYEMKQAASDELKEKMISSLQKRVCFLEKFGYLDDYIEENNEALRALGLSGIEQVKRNPFPDVQYDGRGNIVNTEEIEDMGVIDVFEKENLEKLSPEELLVMEVFWKSKYFVERLEVFEALMTIDFLELWPMIKEEDEKAIQDVEEEKIKKALKRDLALTYLVKNRAAITPELEQRYMQFLEKNDMLQKGTTMEELDRQSEELKVISGIANDLVLGECVIVDELINKELEAKNWGLVDASEFEDFSPIDEKFVMALDMPSFRGTLLFSMDEESINNFFKTKSRNEKHSDVKLPKYKSKLDENYSKAMAKLFLPTSTYFKNYINKKYQENPSSPLLSQLALDFAGGKKIKNRERLVELEVK